MVPSSTGEPPGFLRKLRPTSEYFRARFQPVSSVLFSACDSRALSASKRCQSFPAGARPSVCSQRGDSSNALSHVPIWGHSYRGQAQSRALESHICQSRGQQRPRPKSSIRDLSRSCVSCLQGLHEVSFYTDWVLCSPSGVSWLNMGLCRQGLREKTFMKGEAGEI